MGNYDDKTILKVESVTKKFGKLAAVKDVSLTINRGEVYVLIGPNGAGKTTFMKMIVGLLSPDTGKIVINGFDNKESTVEAKKQFGFISDDPTAYDYLTGWEFITLTGKIRGIPEDELRKKMDELADLFPIKDILHTPMSGYSRGNRQKTAFIAAILDIPAILLIDEPIVGLDPQSIKILGSKIRDYVKGGNSVFYISHNLPFAREYADRVGLMKQGKIIKEEMMGKISSIDKFAENT